MLRWQKRIAKMVTSVCNLISYQVKNLPHPRSLSRRERDEKPLALRDKGTLEAEQRGWGEGKAVSLRNLSARSNDVGVSEHG